MGQVGTPRGPRSGDPSVGAVETSGGEPFAALAETHTSVVVLMGDRAYKAKKAVRLPFVDLSTRAARLANCRREVLLNRRLAPDVYLGVHELRPLEPPLAGNDLDSTGEPVVVMRRMPSDRRLSTLVADPALRPLAHRCVVDVARRVARMHADEPAVHGYGLAATMTALWREGREQLVRFEDTVLPRATLDETDALARAYLAGRGGLLDAREAAGLVRDGHGDLLADDIFWLDDGARILDCLEFDDRLRLGDVLADVAFLAMDLEQRGAADLARLLVDRYRELDAESHPLTLEHHYVAYRAFVRAKVECLRREQGDAAAAGRASALLDLTRRRLRAGRVHLLLVGGLPGTGKSALARAMVDVDDRDWALLSSDEVRKELAGVGPHASHRCPFGQGLYDPAHTAATYAELERRAATALRRGVSVVVDASWTDEGRRATARTLAAEHAAALTEVRCRAPADTCLRRLAERPDTLGSDADEGIYRAMAQRQDAWPQATPVATDACVLDAVGQVLAMLDTRPVGDGPAAADAAQTTGAGSARPDG